MQLLKSPELRSSQLSQTQRMYMLDYPPDAWAISPPALDDLTKLLVVGADPSVPVAVRRVEACCATLVLELTRVCAGCQVSITLDVKFDRRAPATALVVEGQYSMVLNASLCRDMIRNLDEAATSKRPTGSGKGTEVGDPIVLTELYPYVEVRQVPGLWWAGQRKHACGIVGCRYVFRAPTSMSLESLTPEVSKYQTVMLQLHMGNYSQFIPPQYRTSHDATDKDVYMWWTVSVTPDEPSFSSGLVFNIMSDKIAPSFLTSSLGSGSILAVYATLVLAIGRLVRSGLGSPTYMIMFNELKNPDDLMELVEVCRCWWLSA